MKDPDYTMMLMTKYDTLEKNGDDIWRFVTGETVRLKYLENIWNHSTYQHAVEYHNNLQQSNTRIEKTWAISYWPNHVFAFLFGVTEVNILLALTNIYGLELMETIDFEKWWPTYY